MHVAYEQRRSDQRFTLTSRQPGFPTNLADGRWSIQAGIQNLFDEEPQICYSCDLNSFDGTLHQIDSPFWFARIGLLVSTKWSRLKSVAAEAAPTWSLNGKGGQSAAFFLLRSGRIDADDRRTVFQALGVLMPVYTSDGNDQLA